MTEPLPILLDCARSDGGGQRLRTALALSLVTGRPFTLLGFRAGRPEPGLRPAQARLVALAAALCDAAVSGGAEGGSRLEFAPRRAVRPLAGLELDAGPGGSIALLLQTLCWPLALAGGPSELTLRGLTHQPQAPTFHDLALAWQPAVARLGFPVELALRSAGFPGGGGGEVTVRLEPAHAMPPLDLRHRGALREVEVLAFSDAGGPAAAAAQAARAVRALRALGVAAQAERLPLPVHGGAGGHLFLLASFDRTRSGHGALAGRELGGADPVAPAVADLRDHLAGGGAVEPHLADQLLLPAALRASGRVAHPEGLVPTSRWTVGKVTAHLLDTAEVIGRFLEVEVSVLGRSGEPGEVRIQPRGGGLELARLEGPAAGGAAP